MHEYDAMCEDCGQEFILIDCYYCGHSLYRPRTCRMCGRLMCADCICWVENIATQDRTCKNCCSCFDHFEEDGDEDEDSSSSSTITHSKSYLTGDGHLKDDANSNEWRNIMIVIIISFSLGFSLPFLIGLWGL